MICLKFLGRVLDINVRALMARLQFVGRILDANVRAVHGENYRYSCLGTNETFKVCGKNIRY